MVQQGCDFSAQEAIIFDLGGVILNLDYQKTTGEFKKLIPHLDPNTFYGKKAQLEFFSDYEIGKIDTETFLRRFNEHYHSALSLIEFSRCWNAMVFDVPLERIKLLRQLKTLGKKLFLLSNINELHELAAEKEFKRTLPSVEWRTLFDKVYYSHRIGLRKPCRGIFQHVLNENNLRPELTLFIDDSLQHILGANELNIKCIHLEKGCDMIDIDLFADLLSSHD